MAKINLPSLMSKGLLLVISGPSGSGKSTLCRALLKRFPRLYYSVSCTTRPPRPSEVPGQDYLHITEEAFKTKIEKNEFLEWARVHDHLYGTPREPLLTNINNGTDVVFDVDTQGALSILESHPDSISVFVYPPSWESLEQRLRKRGQDEASAISKRLVNARNELRLSKHYTYLIVNQNVENAVGDLSSILRAEHRRMSRLTDEVEQFLKEVENK